MSDGVLRRVSGPLLLLAALAAAVALSSAAGSRQLQLTTTEMLVRMAVVVGMQVFVGNSGILSFGHIGFMCIGAYAAGWAACDPQWKDLMLTGLPAFLRDHQYPMPAVVLGSGLLAGAVALLFGLPIVRLSGIAASIATFSFLVIVNTVYSNWDSVTAGTSSLVGVPTVVGPWWAYLFAAAALGIAYAFYWSGAALKLRAARDDEVAAAASGIETRRLRLLAFVLSGFVVGAAGGVYAHFLGVLTTDTFYLDLTFTTVAMLIVGGMGTPSGAVAGVVLLTLVIELLRIGEAGVEFKGNLVGLPHSTQEIGLGVLMALTLIFRPEGVTGGRELAVPRRWRWGAPRAAPKPRTEAGDGPGRRGAEAVARSDLRGSADG